MGKQRQKRNGEKNLLNLTEITKLEKVPTGIRGLDEILHGGLPRGRSTIVVGGPGTGKSILGMEFLAYRAQNGSPGIFVTFEERADALRKNALTLGIDLPTLEKDGSLFMLDARPNPEAVISGDFDLKGMLAIIGGKAAKMGAKFIVFDAIDVLMKLYSDPTRERKELYVLHNWLLDRQFTTIITVKNDGYSYPGNSFLDFMMDCVIVMDARPLEQVTTRRIRIVKFRGSSYSSNEHPFIFKNGIRVIPMSSVLLSKTLMVKRVTSGNRELDAMLNGGYLKGACILLAGQSGTGKTTAACLFAQRACARKEKVLFVSYEESTESILTNMLSPGIDLAPALKAGTLRFLNSMPESRAAEEHLADTIDIIDEFQPGYVVVDAISACVRMGNIQTAFEFVTRLVNACKERGVTIFLVNQLDKTDDSYGVISGIGISSLMDTAVLIQYRRDGKKSMRVIEIMKSRGTKHSNEMREFIINDKGIEIGGSMPCNGESPAAVDGKGRAHRTGKSAKGGRE